MNTKELIKTLGYKGSPTFLEGDRLKEHQGYSFFFTQAEKKEYCNLKGVYTLLDSPNKLSNSSLTPVVYICEAETEVEAREIHQKVWNQNIVPFLIVVTPKNIRLYSGFEYDRNQSDENQILEIAEDANDVLNKLSAFKSEAIDSGNIWDHQKISTDNRVDRHLLMSLEKLAEVLTDNNYNLPLKHAHSLIGKYIYLKYLRDRDILSDERFEKAKINIDDIFGHNATKDKVYQLEDYLDVFLKGSVFPLPSKNNIRAEHIKKVASVFKGDDPESNQQVLFDMYNFSYIPIETLSVVYQQFLHQKGQGKEKGAYYTPVHLVNFILDELDAKKPLKDGMKIFDPSCGSGAFLVQCYRRLIETTIRDKKTKLNPTDLRRLLVDHIFGLDADEEACRVAELSLSLTLLDYIDPPDLTKTNFQLPDLHNKNIFHCEEGFFDDKSVWTKFIPQTGYDWIVGNPPWKNVDKSKDRKPYHRQSIEWIDDNQRAYPVDNYQLAEAFAWKTTQLLNEDGQCGLLMPAMTLFKKQGRKFRSKFFSQIETWCVVNFANIRRYLFEEAINPAAAFFYSGKKNWNKSEHYITTYAPFAIEQSSQLNQNGTSKKIWSIFVNYSTVKEISLNDIMDGSSVPWKTAMWGTHRDKCLLDIISRRHDDILAFTNNKELFINEGPQFRSEPKGVDSETLKKFKVNHKYLPTYAGKYVLATDRVLGDPFQLPNSVYDVISKDAAYLRIRGGEAGLKLFKAPHIVISASRSFSIYSDVDFMIPPRQIGIAGDNKQKLLKALALYLKSDFVKYQQWMTSAAWGVERDRPNLDDLKKLPIPFAMLSDDKFTEWANLHDQIVETEKREILAQTKYAPTLWDKKKTVLPEPDASVPKLSDLLKEMNDNVYKLLGIDKKQRWLIEDVLNVRMKLNDGVFNIKDAKKPATEKEMHEFACIFQEELDLFLDHTGNKKVHKIKVLCAGSSSVIIVDHLTRSTKTKPEVVEVQENKIRQELDEVQKGLTEIRSQWMYFTRCLRIYEKRRTYIFKPSQRLYWLKGQALAEADEFIAEKLASK